MARGRGEPHCSAPGSRVPRIGIDYFYITKGGVKLRDELEMTRDEEIEKARTDGEIVKCVIIRCFESKAIFAHCIPCKGADEGDYVAKLVAADISWIGYCEMIIKADNEVALQALVKRVIELVKLQSDKAKRVTTEQPARYESQSNGGTETGVRLVRGLFRTLRICLEARIEKHVPTTHALMPWLLEHTCMILNTRVRSDDGLTAWARVRGRSFSQQLLGFAEAVLYNLPGKGPGHDPDGNMGARWDEGIFLGYHRSSNVYIVATPRGITTARSLKRRPMANRWCSEKLAAIRATPWSEREQPEVTVRFQEEAARAEGPEAAPAQPQLRRFRINKKDLEEHGYTDGCVMCDHMARYGTAKPGCYHTDTCRTRMLAEIAKTEAGQQRLTAWNTRVNRAIAEQIERADGAAQDARAPEQSLESSLTAPASNVAMSSRPLASSSQPTTRDGSGEGSFLPADEPVTAKPSDEPRSAERGLRAWDEAMGPPQQAEAAEEEEETPKDTDMGYIGSLEPSVEDVASQILLQQLGSTGRAYKREIRRGFKALISEVYSPPRITEELKRRPRPHLLPGFAFDLTVCDPDDGEPWDFTRRDKREKARALLRQRRPFLLIGSPACTAFSTWQYLNAQRTNDPEKLHRQKVAAKLHLDFVASLYVEQIQAGGYFLHEHPRFATSWQLPVMEELLKIRGVERVNADQCQFGAEIQRGPKTGSPTLKPTGFMSNSPKLLEILGRQCTGTGGMCSRPAGGRHVALEGRHTRDSQRYPRALCQAVLRGATAQLRYDRRLKPGCYGIQAVDDDEEVHASLYGPEQGYSGKYKDDLTGQVLRDDLVQAARLKELEYFTAKGVWIKVPLGRARQATGRPPITVRWVDVNKGDDANPNYRSRLVARQLKAMDKSGDTFFAPAPPIEALRTVLSLAMTRIGDHQPNWDPSSATRTQISFVDVSRAYFNAKIDQDAAPTFVNLPPEDPKCSDHCAQLLRHMYGTRMAADGWQEEYSTLLIRLGFTQGISCPNVFYHGARRITCSVHGDDFTSSGPKDALDWLEQSIGEEYEITIGPRLGPGPRDAKEARALNRVVRWCDDRIEYEADPRQVERLVEECGLNGANPMATPSVKPTFAELEGDELPAKLHTAFRGAAARGNYLAADRIDAQFSCKEVCRWMSKPAVHSWKALKRLCRYFNGNSRLVYVYRQQSVDCVDVYTDTDWAGCPKTRKSTSGGSLMMGRHTIKHWSSTQASVALSSGEAEFNGVIRGAGQGLGYQALLKDLGVTAPLRVWTDSSAAIGICSRQGLGKLRHLDTHTLWVQQAVRNKRIDLRKIAGEHNPADLLTKHSHSREKLQSLVELHDCRFLAGRAESAPALKRGASSKTTMATADAELNDVELQEEQEEHCTAPRMPHHELDAAALDREYPSLVAPPDDGLQDIVDDAADSVYQHGLEVAQEISESMAQHGRTRRDLAAAPHS